jgi:TPR repeat protein
MAKVLIFRTGIGLRRRYSRREVARMVRVSVAREGRMERRAVAALAEAGADGSCPRATRASEPGTLFAMLEDLSSTPFSAFQGPAPAQQASPTTSVANRSGSRGRRVEPQGRRAVSAATAVLPFGPLPHSGSGFPFLILVGVALLAGAALLTPYARRAVVRTGVGPTGDLEEALVAYRRADELGDPSGVFNLGLLLAERGDVTRALAAFRRADELGDGAGAANHGLLLERRGDLDGALAAYRRADQRGDATGAFNLAGMLAERGDVTGARRAYRRASARGDPDLAKQVSTALRQLRRLTEP